MKELPARLERFCFTDDCFDEQYTHSTFPSIRVPGKIFQSFRQSRLIENYRCILILFPTVDYCIIFKYINNRTVKFYPRSPTQGTYNKKKSLYGPFN